MTISRSVYNQLFEQAPDAAGGATKEKVIRLRPTEAKAGAVVMSAKNKIQMWTKEEHERFLAALEKFPAGPWKKVADFIGSKTPRQTMTHAQKYRQKIHRRQRGLRNQKKSNTNANLATTTTGTGPTPVDIKADPKGEPKTIVSPYGVADLQLKAGSEAVAAAAAAAGVTNDQLLNILAQQATTINQDKPEPMEVDSVVTVETTASAETAAAVANEGSPVGNNNLPSLAEILHLGGAEGQTLVPAQGVRTEGEKKESKTETKNEEDTEAEGEFENAIEPTKNETEAKDQMQTRPEGCKCNCSCNAHGGNKSEEVEETTAQPRPDESK